MALTELQVKNAKPKDKPYKIADGKGMILWVTPAGGKHWRLRYRFLGKEKTLAMGSHPETSLTRAREKAFEARKLLAEGIDPSADKKETKIAALTDAAMTLEVVTQKWLDLKQRKISESYFRDTKARVERHILPTLGPKPVNGITSLEIIKVLEKIDAHAPDMARRIKQVLGEIYQYGVSHMLIKQNIMRDIDSRHIFGKQEKDHHASLAPSELPEFLKVLRSNKACLYRTTHLAVELLMLTFVRTGELINAPWSEIDWKANKWVIPAARMKMRQDHIVPLSTQALAILKELHEMNGHRDFIFPGHHDPRKPMSNGAILQALERMGYRGRMTGHGFRALAMTTLKENLGYRHEVVDRQLAHAPKNKIDAAYDRTHFLKERQKMMQDWADYLEAL